MAYIKKADRKPKEEASTNTTTLDEILKGQIELAKSIDSLSVRVKELEEKEVKVHIDDPITSTASILTKLASDTTSYNPITTNDYNPIPSAYSDEVRKVLNQKFGIDLIYSSDLPQFEFTIIIPDEYCTMPQNEKDIKKVDLRTKVIKHSEGINGVKEWAERVFNTFPPELKAKITIDRK